MPCYNKENTLERSLSRLLAIEEDELALDFIIVDDGSRDRIVEITKELAAKFSQIRVFEHERNRGKGAALRTGFAAATGDFVGAQDADLEYAPAIFADLPSPLLTTRPTRCLARVFYTPAPGWCSTIGIRWATRF